MELRDTLSWLAELGLFGSVGDRSVVAAEENCSKSATMVVTRIAGGTDIVS